MLLTVLSTLGIAECLVRNDTTGKMMKVTIRNVESPFATSSQYYSAIEIVKTKLRALHGFMIEPDLSPSEEARRLSAFVEQLNGLLGNNDADAVEADEIANGDDDEQEAFG